jgi:hypothetical protein
MRSEKKMQVYTFICLDLLDLQERKLQLIKSTNLKFADLQVYNSKMINQLLKKLIVAITITIFLILKNNNRLPQYCCP